MILFKYRKHRIHCSSIILIREGASLMMKLQLLIVIILLSWQLRNCSELLDPIKILMDEKRIFDPELISMDPKRSGHRSLCERNRRTRCYKLSINRITKTICFMQPIRCFAMD